MACSEKILHFLAKYYLIVLFCLFFLISFGLGYPTLNRYDPRKTGLNDTNSYYAMTLFKYDQADPKHRSRVLTPILSSVVFSVVSCFNFRTWDIVFLSLLIINSLFTAGTGLILFKICEVIQVEHQVGILSAFLFFCSFIIPNAHLSGMVDAGEVFFFSALILALCCQKWYLLPPIMILGTSAKETLVGFGLAYMVGWSLSFGVLRIPWKQALLMVISIILGAGAVIVTLYIIDGQQILLPPLTIERIPNLLPKVLDIIFSNEFIMTFWFLLPLGIWRLHRLPRPFVWGSIAAILMAMGLCVCILPNPEFAKNSARPIFNVAAPVFAISAAIFLQEVVKKKGHILYHRNER